MSHEEKQIPVAGVIRDSTVIGLATSLALAMTLKDFIETRWFHLRINYFVIKMSAIIRI
jgi:hypothetical protein